MSEITVDELTKEHLDTYSRIDALGDNEAKTIWTDRKLAAFVGSHVDAPELKTLYIKLPAFAEEAINNLKDRIAQIDPLGRKRLVS